MVEKLINVTLVVSQLRQLAFIQYYHQGLLGIFYRSDTVLIILELPTYVQLNHLNKLHALNL